MVISELPPIRRDLLERGGMAGFAAEQQVGPYRIVRPLGVGGMGAVYEARRALIGGRVALKVLHPHVAQEEASVRRFFNEAKALSMLEHPGIVHVFDFGYTEDGLAYLAMEFLQGQSLAERLQQQRKAQVALSVPRILQIAKEAAEVLARCHAEGIVHRDLKPENLMLVADPVAPAEERLKLLDFGIAKFLRPMDTSGAKTGTKELLGTPMYMSPEQFSASTDVDGKADVYSLGCVLYEALAGRPPFIAAEGWQFVGMHMFQTPTPLKEHAPQTPSVVCDLVQRLLAKDRDARPSMAELAVELDQCLASLSGQAKHTSPHRLSVPFVAETGLFAGSGLAAWVRSKSERSRRVSAALAACCGLAVLSAGLTWFRALPSRHLPAQMRMTAATPPASPEHAHTAPLENSAMVTEPLTAPRVPASSCLGAACDAAEPMVIRTATIPPAKPSEAPVRARAASKSTTFAGRNASRSAGTTSRAGSPSAELQAAPPQAPQVPFFVKRFAR